MTPRVFKKEADARVELAVLANGEVGLSLCGIPMEFWEFLVGSKLEQFASALGGARCDVHFVSYATLNPIATEWNTQGESHAG